MRWLSSRPALWVAAAWGLAEASFFFIVPDFWLGLVALFAPRRAFRTLGAIAIGAVAGAALLALAATMAPGGVADLLNRLPGIAPADLAQARGELEAQGVIAFLNAPLQGLPVKIYVHEATQLGLPAPLILVFTALNRIERIGLFGLVMVLVGLAARRVAVRFPRTIGVGYLAAWAIFYAAYWSGRPG